MEDFSTLDLIHNRKKKRVKLTRDKGHRRELELTLQTMKSGAEAPIPINEIFHITDATFAVLEALASAAPVTVGRLRRTEIASTQCYSLASSSSLG
jgi:hypothetical protein